MRKRVLFRVLLQTIVRQLSARMMFNANNEKRSLERPSLNLPTRVKPLPKRRFPTLFSDRCFRFLRSVNQASYKGCSAIWDVKVRMLCIALCFCNESDWIKRVASCVCVCDPKLVLLPLWHNCGTSLCGAVNKKIEGHVIECSTKCKPSTPVHRKWKRQWIRMVKCVSYLMWLWVTVMASKSLPSRRQGQQRQNPSQPQEETDCHFGSQQFQICSRL